MKMMIIGIMFLMEKKELIEIIILLKEEVKI